MVTPDVAGFEEAQNRLRDETGAEVVFRLPATAEWPTGVPLDPETGRPFDPTVKPTGSAMVTASARVGVAFSTTGQQTETAATGLWERTHATLIVGSGDVLAHDLEQALEVQLRGELYKIEAFKPDGIKDRVHRWLAFVRRR